MLDIVLMAIGLAASGGAEAPDSAGIVQEDPKVTVATTEIAAAPGFQAEDQTPTGRFTTATEVKPVLELTKNNWIAVREWEGQDLLYFTHLLSWRCGMKQISYAVNGGPLMTYDLPPCHDTAPAPNAILQEDGLPYVSYGLNTIAMVEVQLVLDDLSTMSAKFNRNGIEIP